MQIIQLFTGDSKFVAEEKVPTMNPMATVIMWGSRVFQWDPTLDAPSGVMAYREAFTYYIHPTPPSK